MINIDCPWCEAPVAIEGLEAWLTLVAEPKDSPAKLAELFWTELQSRMRSSPIQC